MIMFINQYLICLEIYYINDFDLCKSFNPDIQFSYNDNHNLRIVNPAEKISDFSGLNFPNPDQEYIYNSSGDIYRIVPLAVVLAKVFFVYLDSPKSDNLIKYFLCYICIKMF